MSVLSKRPYVVAREQKTSAGFVRCIRSRESRCIVGFLHKGVEEGNWDGFLGNPNGVDLQEEIDLYNANRNEDFNPLDPFSLAEQWIYIDVCERTMMEAAERVWRNAVCYGAK